MTRFIILYISAIMLIACEGQELPEPSLAVEAYLYTGKPVRDIKLSLVKPINGIDEQVPVSDATVYIIWNNRYYPLEEDTIPGNFVYRYTNLKIESEETYTLQIKYHNQDYFAETTVPKPPIDLQISKDTLLLNNGNDLIDVNWQNSDSTWYLGVIAPGKEITTEFPFNNFFSLPTRGSKLSVTPEDIHIVGPQKFVLYGITEEYEKLFRISNSSIGSSNVGNLSNGFGIFAAFSSDTLSFVTVDN